MKKLKVLAVLLVVTFIVFGTAYSDTGTRSTVVCNEPNMDVDANLSLFVVNLHVGNNTYLPVPNNVYDFNLLYYLNPGDINGLYWKMDPLSLKVGGSFYPLPYAVCDSQHLNLCFTDYECRSVGGSWCNGVCKSNCGGDKIRLDVKRGINDCTGASITIGFASRISVSELLLGDYKYSFDLVSYSNPSDGYYWKLDLSTFIEKPILPSTNTFVEPMTGMEFVYVPEGCFQMGSVNPNEQPVHDVCLSEFWMAKYETTQKQWKVIMGDYPFYFREDNNPVETVSWHDAKNFILKLNQSSDRVFALPSEAQWEYASRVGSVTPFAFGECLSTEYANYNGDRPLDGCFKGEYRKKTVTVGSFLSNNFGLYDMHGNVWEWCEDWYGVYSPDFVTNPEGHLLGSNRVIRGGSWNTNAWLCRSTYRNVFGPDFRSNDIGFRLVLSSGQR